MMYADILLLTDSSDLAGNAIQHGIALAKDLGAKVIGLTVVRPLHMFTTDTQMLKDTLPQYKARMRGDMPRKLLAPSQMQRRRQA
jgi:nucleotide-binding universal stress UspA family protein